MIANVTSGGDFGGALDYLMNPKKGQEERALEEAHARERERPEGREHGPPEGAERDPPAEARARGEPGHQEGVERERAKGGAGRREEEPRMQEEERPRGHERDLADEYEPGQRHRIIGGNMSGRTPRELEREFKLVSELRPGVEKPVHHASLSAAEGDRLTVAEWQEIGDTYAEKMGFGNSPYVIIQHRWSDKDHVHVLGSRVDFDGEVVSEWLSKERAEVVMREVEEKYDLERLPLSKDVMRAAPTRGEQEVFERTGELSVKMRLQGHVEQALRDGPTASEFIERLRLVGVDVIPYVRDTGRVSGVTFRQGDELMKGSDLGRGFSWGGLQKRGLDYDESRDRPAVEAALERAEAERARERDGARQAPSPEPEHVAELETPEAARSVEEYLLDFPDPAHQVGVQPRAAEQAERVVADLQAAARDLPGRQDGLAQLQSAAGLDSADRETVERLLQQAAGIEPAGREAVERLQQAAGIEPGQDGRDVLEHLNTVAGVERQDAATPGLTPDHAPGAAPVLEPTVEREAQEQVIERGLEMSR